MAIFVYINNLHTLPYGNVAMCAISAISAMCANSVIMLLGLKLLGGAVARFIVGSPVYMKKTLEPGDVPAWYPAGTEVEIGADQLPGRDWKYVEGSGDHTPWQAPAAVPWAQTGLAHDLAAFDARK